MWIRKRLDIRYRDLLRAALDCCRGDEPDLVRTVEESWSERPSVVCLSARTGLDLYLRARRFPVGSEVLFSGLNIPDMARVAERNGLTAVAVDFDLARGMPTVEDIDRAHSGRTRAVVVAQLFGARTDLSSLAELCERRGWDLIEDAAQAFAPGYRGDPAATISLFSFGPIKTATALGGATVTVNSPSLARRMRTLERALPPSTRWPFLRRVLKYTTLQLLSSKPVFRWIAATCRWRGQDLDALLAPLARNFTGDLMASIRRRPAPPLLRLLRHRLRSATVEGSERRRRKGRALVDLIGPDRAFGGGRAERSEFWVFPVRVDDPRRLRAKLERHGFDATSVATMTTLAALPLLEEDLAQLLYLPFDPTLPMGELQRMATIVLSK